MIGLMIQDHFVFFVAPFSNVSIPCHYHHHHHHHHAPLIVALCFKRAAIVPDITFTLMVERRRKGRSQ
jgi:hypothetical protein